MKRWQFAGPVLTLAAVLTGCMGDSDSTTGIEGTGGTVTATGSVTAYGSIYVNGLHIDIDTAELTAAGESAGVADIQLGMVVDVELASAAENPVAQRVDYLPGVTGPVETVTEEGDVRRRITVLGQTITLYDDTQFEGITFEDIEPGLPITVSGFRGPEESWLASRVSGSDDNTLQLQGVVNSLSTEEESFRLGGWSVDYSGATLSGASLTDGARVLVSGGSQSAGEWQVDSVFVLEAAGPSSGDTLYREGVIRDYDGLSSFRVGNLTVDATSADVVGRPSALRAGARVAVEGTFQGGTLVAETVRVLPAGVNRIRGAVDAVDAANQQFTVMGTTYSATALTTFEDRVQPGRASLTLAQLQTGDRVDVFAHYRRGRLTATRVRRLEVASDSILLRGPITAIDLDTSLVRIMGVTVDLSGAEGASLLAELTPGTQVQVEGEMTGTREMSATSLREIVLPADIDNCPEAVAERCESVPAMN